MVMYEVSKWSNEVRKVKADRLTEKSIWINGRRQLLKTEWSIFFDNFDDAKNNIIERLNNNISSTESELKQLKKKLKEAEEQEKL